MASKKVLQLIDIFRNHFQSGKAADIPLALRSAPVDVVFTALLEEDAPTSPPLTPMMDALPSTDPFNSFAPDLGGMDMGIGMGEPMAPIGPQDAPGAPAATPVAPGGVGSLEDMLAGF